MLRRAMLTLTHARVQAVSNVLLKWHTALVAAAGEGCIIRYLAHPPPPSFVITKFPACCCPPHACVQCHVSQAHYSGPAQHARGVAAAVEKITAKAKINEEASHVVQNWRAAIADSFTCYLFVCE
jgi:hypothetical protein